MHFQETSAVIQVDMEVTQCQVFREDGMVQVWGYVGDYEVCLYLPLADAQAKGLIPKEPTGRAGGKRKKDRP